MPRPQPPPSPRPRPRPGVITQFIFGGGGSRQDGSDSELSLDYHLCPWPDNELDPERRWSEEAERLNFESEASVSLDDYVYSSLADPHLDIRLVELLPGVFGETIRVRIHHVPLVEPELKEDPRIPVKNLAETCPEPWSVCRNLEGQALFWRRGDDDAITTSWRHPNPEFNSSQYDLPPLEIGNTLESKFEALSYAWGSGKKSASIIVQGDFVAKLAVTRSLLEALQHLRDGTQPRMMWIDAVCLNQEDTVEKDLQLPRMRDIYRLAYRVVVWLGLNARSFEQDHKYRNDKIPASTFNELEYIAAQVEVSEDGASLWPAPDAVEKDWYRSDNLRQSASQEYQLTLYGLKELLRSRWFGRLWVVQEIQLANKRPGPIMQCGSYTISVSKFHRAVECLGLKTANTDNHFRDTVRGTPLMLEKPVLNAIRLLHPMSSVNHRIISTLNRNRECQNDRDRVYGLLGLTSKQFSDQTQVRYDRPTADVYKDHFLRHSQLSGRLELLIDHPWDPWAIRKGLPTWVPDWSAGADCRDEINIQFAAHNTRAYFKHDIHASDILNAYGVRCAVVESLVECLPMQYERQPWKAVRKVRKWQPDDLDTAKYLPTGQPLRTAYALTLLQEDVEGRWQSLRGGGLAMKKSCARTEPLLRARTYSTFSPDRWVHDEYNRPSSQEWVDHDYDHSLFGRQSEGHRNKHVPDTIPHPHIMKALNGCYGRRLFHTHEGYMGLAPTDTRKGDTVAIILGCLNPVILRPVHERNGTLSSPLTFEYVGECSVHGLQDSTWLLGLLPRPWISCIVQCPGMRICLGFKNTETGVETLEDPRLEMMDAWERFCPEEDKIERHFPFDYCFFRNKETGEVVMHDPRLEPAELEARGIELTWFSLK